MLKFQDLEHILYASYNKFVLLILEENVRRFELISFVLFYCQVFRELKFTEK